MDEAVGALGGRPLLIRTATPYKLTKIAVDQVYDVTLKKHDVIFVGTGKLLLSLLLLLFL